MDRISELEKENRWLREEIRKLRCRLALQKESEWVHPKSCVHNCDPWETWNYQK